MFHIHAIRVFEECDRNLRKNLQAEWAFEFQKPLWISSPRTSLCILSLEKKKKGINDIETETD